MQDINNCPKCNHKMFSKKIIDDVDDSIGKEVILFRILIDYCEHCLFSEIKKTTLTKS